MALVDILALISVALTLTVVLVVAFYLIGVYWALRKGRGHLAKLGTVNAGLSAIAPPLLAANANLARIVEVATRG